MAVAIVEAVTRVEATLPLAIAPGIGAVGVGRPTEVKGRRQFLAIAGAIGA